MPGDRELWTRRIEDVELILADLDEAWRERWSTIDAFERTRLLNVELMDADRFLAGLRDARRTGQLDEEQTARLERVEAARAAARPMIDAMAADVRGAVEDEQRRRARKRRARKVA